MDDLERAGCAASVPTRMEGGSVNRVMKAIERAYARPPLSWTVVLFNALASAAARPLRPFVRQHALRKQVELDEMSIRLALVGLTDQAAELAALAAQYGRIAAGTPNR